MKNIATILSVISLILVAILFFLFFGKQSASRPATVSVQRSGDSSFRIAYFDIDSLEAHYLYFLEALKQVKEMENDMNNELGNMEKGYQKKIGEWQKKGASMTQAESEQAQQEYANMQQAYQARKQKLQEGLFKNNENLKSEIKKKIEDFLKDYNKDKRFSFIFAYEANSFMYYKDTTYNITQDLIDGLNLGYKKK